MFMKDEVADLGIAYNEKLKMLSKEDQLEEIMQFIIDAMDYNEQSDREDLYVFLYEKLNEKYPEVELKLLSNS